MYLKVQLHIKWPLKNAISWLWMDNCTFRYNFHPWEDNCSNYFLIYGGRAAIFLYVIHNYLMHYSNQLYYAPLESKGVIATIIFSGVKIVPKRTIIHSKSGYCIFQGSLYVQLYLKVQVIYFLNYKSDQKKKVFFTPHWIYKESKKRHQKIFPMYA